MSTYRRRRAAASAVNSAVISRVTGVKAVAQARAEAILTKFIATSEAIAASGAEENIAFSAIGMSNGSGNTSVLGQLKRVQRDLRGLPPLLADLDTCKQTGANSQEPQNKKITFGDDGELVHNTGFSNKYESQAQPNGRGDDSMDRPIGPTEDTSENTNKSENEENMVDAVVAVVSEKVLGKRLRYADEEETLVVLDNGADEGQKREGRRQEKLAKKERKEKKEKEKKKLKDSRRWRRD